MGRKRLQKTTEKRISPQPAGENAPTRERIRRGGVTLKSGGAQVEDPLRIDKLLKAGILDEMQHLYGLQIITLWHVCQKPQLRATRYEPVRGQRPDFTHMALGRMGAEDLFYKTMGRLNRRDHGLISKICFEEMAAIAAGRSLALPVNSITAYVRAAFDALGNALAESRKMKKELESSERPFEKV